ncbi:MAG: hypothetical protein RLZZ416_2 [Candidatus Parcubacteria bacterium]|jgi:DNA-binding transcriptional regulator PaaX
MEAESTRRARKNELKRIILGSVKVAGLLSLAIVAPNVIGAMAKLGIIASPRERYIVEKSCSRLVRSGLLEWKDKKLRLTQKGRIELGRLEAREFSAGKPRRWDEKWRMLIFDIPEYRKGLRDKIRRTLLTIGFVRLQDSVWAYPYDCEDLITLLKADFKIGKDMLYVIADSIEQDKKLRESFGLPI